MNQPFLVLSDLAIEPLASRSPTISGIANSPNPTTTRGTPSKRYNVSKVYLGSPVIGAVPIDPIINPRKQEAIPLN